MTLPSRDSVIWDIMFYAGAGIFFAANFIDNPMEYGISVMAFKWLKLVAAFLGFIGAKNGWSWVDLKRP